MRRLVVTADDLGAGRSVDDRILRCADEGIVTRASLLVPGPSAVEAARRARGRLAVGVHLDLTEGRALTGPIRGATDARGRFVGLPALLRAALLRRLDLEACGREFEAQVERAAELGLSVLPVDGHHHVHVFPGLFPFAVEAARRAGARAIRVPAEPIAARPRGASFKRAFLRFCSRGKRREARRAGLAVADHFRGLALYGRRDDHLERLLELLRRLPRGTTELMCHPRPGPSGEAEAGSLRARQVLSVLEERDISLAPHEGNGEQLPGAGSGRSPA